jgi:DNA mismatch endonuclease, patch repair protein
MCHTQAVKTKAQALANPAKRAAKPFESWATSPAVRRVMQCNKSRDTKPEMAVRCAVHAMGMRYRVAARPLVEVRRTADLVFRRAKVAVFVDGCFWHGCRMHHAPPKTNADYWVRKIKSNRFRDRHTTALLKAAGWTVLRFWSHEEPLVNANRIVEVVQTKNREAVVSVAKRSVVCQRASIP